MRFLQAKTRVLRVVGVAVLPFLGLLGLIVGLTECGRQIDWADFVQVGNIQYVSVSVGGRHVTATDLGPEQAKVRFKAAGSFVAPRWYQPHDGDAAFLEAGTPLYAVNGYSPSFRLAAALDGAFRVYEVVSNPAAKVGGDLLDIAGKVTAIDVQPEGSATPTVSPPLPTTITDPERITHLVDLIIQAPIVSHPQESSGPRLLLTFELADGTTTKAIYFPDSGLLRSSIAVPPAFRTALESTP